MDALSGIDAEGKENAPGWSLEALEYIYKVRNAAANGHETLDTDSSAVAEEKGDLACERYVLDNDKLQVEVLANLDKVQPAGAVVIVSYPRIEGATGLPMHGSGGREPAQVRYRLPGGGQRTHRRQADLAGAGSRRRSRGLGGCLQGAGRRVRYHKINAKEFCPDLRP